MTFAISVPNALSVTKPISVKAISKDDITVKIGDITFDKNIILNSNMTLIADSITLDDCFIDSIGTIKVKTDETDNVRIIGNETIIHTGGTIINIAESKSLTINVAVQEYNEIIQINGNQVDDRILQ